MKIEQVGKAITDFIKKTIGKDAKVVKVEKSDNGWTGEAEVYEESSFIKSLGLATKVATKVQDRNIYEIELNDKLEVISYARNEEMAVKE